MPARMTRKYIVCSLAAGLTVATYPALGSDVTNGKRLAQQWCSPCHVVAPDQRQLGSEAAPFREVAQRPGFDAAKLAFFLLNPHPAMPNMGLSRSEAADLAAYIETLK
jgi:mono/diheme cytochrome c family protein